MAKRFTDTEKWKKQWFRKLPDEMKLFWYYICDNCNIAGIWDVDLELASFLIGQNIEKEVALKYMEKQIKILSESKWFILDFVKFQYGELVPNNNLHRSVLLLLEKSGASQGLVSPLAGDKVKVKVDNTTLHLNTENIIITKKELKPFTFIPPKEDVDKLLGRK